MLTQIVGQVALQRVVEIVMRCVRRNTLIDQFAVIVGIEPFRDGMRGVGDLIGELLRERAGERQNGEIVAKIEIGIDLLR